MKFLKVLLALILVPVLAIGALLLLGVVTEYKPALVSQAKVFQPNEAVLKTSQGIQLTTFNIGYAGLDKGRDFFMEGGKESGSISKAQTETNLKGISHFLKGTQSDIMLIQEIDLSGKRSFNIDETAFITSELPAYEGTFAMNYNVKWVPVPFQNPMGGVESGILTLSKGHALSSTRYSLPGDEPIPKRYFDLKRCVMENVYPLDNGKKLTVINVHLSAYDKGGEVRKQQVDWLIAHIKDLRSQSDNYLIVGGDWNHLMSQALRDKIEGEVPGWAVVLPEKLSEETGMKVAYDADIPTSRSNEQPYQKGVNFEATIDGFLYSPNLRLLSVKATDLGFTNADHNPVTIQLGFE